MRHSPYERRASSLLRLADLLRREHHALADFLVALADFDRERRWLALGYTSCFYYLHREFGLSKGAAFYRKTAAELLQRFPEIVEPLRDGRLCLTSVVELAKVITRENRGEVVPRFFHASKQEAKEVAAELRPAEVAPRREVVTVLRPAAARPAHEPTSAPAAPRTIALDLAQPVHPENQPERVPSAPEPLTADLRRLHLTVSKRMQGPQPARGTGDLRRFVDGAVHDKGATSRLGAGLHRGRRGRYRDVTTRPPYRCGSPGAREQTVPMSGWRRMTYS